LSALHAIHDLQLVHLDVKGDNVCIPVGPPKIDPDAPGAHLYPLFGQLALIDFAFSLISREMLTSALPIGWQKNYDYQSPRLLHALEAGRNGDLQPTRELDWRCDMYSLAAMLKRYLPDDDLVHDRAQVAGWCAERYHAAKALILAIRDAHDREALSSRPHHDLLQLTGAQLADADMIASLEAGWTLARDANVATAPALPLTPLTRLAPSVRVTQSPDRALVSMPPLMVSPRPMQLPPRVMRRRTPPTAITVRAPAVSPADTSARAWVTPLLLVLIGVSSVIAVAPHFDDGVRAPLDGVLAAIDRLRGAFDGSGRTAEAPVGSSARDRAEPLGQAPPSITAPEHEDNGETHNAAGAAPEQHGIDKATTERAPPPPPTVPERAPAPAPAGQRGPGCASQRGCKCRADRSGAAGCCTPVGLGAGSAIVAGCVRAASRSVASIDRVAGRLGVDGHEAARAPFGVARARNSIIDSEAGNLRGAHATSRKNGVDVPSAAFVVEQAVRRRRGRRTVTGYPKRQRVERRHAAGARGRRAAERARSTGQRHGVGRSGVDCSIDEAGDDVAVAGRPTRRAGKRDKRIAPRRCAASAAATPPRISDVASEPCQAWRQGGPDRGAPRTGNGVG
jgi:hypothetical protein